MLHFSKILVPMDFTVHALSAFHVAAALARDHGANLCVLHVCERPPAPVAHFGGGPAPEPEPHKELLQRLEHVEAFDSPDKAECVVVDGAPAEEIIRAALERSCDLIVMGTHGRTGLGRLVMGSVAQEVMRKAPCPVMTVRFPMPAAEAPLGAARSTSLMHGSQ